MAKLIWHNREDSERGTMADNIADNPTETSPSPKEIGSKGEILPSRKGRFDGGRLAAVFIVLLAIVAIFAVAAVADLTLRDRPNHGEVAGATVRVSFDDSSASWNLLMVKDGRSIGMERCPSGESSKSSNSKGILARNGCWEAHSNDGLDAILNYSAPWKQSSEQVALSLDGGQSWEDMRCGSKSQNGDYLCFNIPPRAPDSEIGEPDGSAPPY
jgi:hypothetical protein